MISNLHVKAYTMGEKMKLLPLLCGSIGWSVVPYTKEIVGLIPGHCMYLGCGFNSLSGIMEHMGSKQLMVLISMSPSLSFYLSSIYLSLSLSFSPSLPSSKTNKYILK